MTASPHTLILPPDNGSAAAAVGAIARVGAIANTHAAAHSFADYRNRKSPHTIRRHDAALGVFSYYLAIVHVRPGAGPYWVARSRCPSAAASLRLRLRLEPSLKLRSSTSASTGLTVPTWSAVSPSSSATCSALEPATYSDTARSASSGPILSSHLGP